MCLFFPPFFLRSKSLNVLSKVDHSLAYTFQADAGKTVTYDLHILNYLIRPHFNCNHLPSASRNSPSLSLGGLKLSFSSSTSNNCENYMDGGRSLILIKESLHLCCRNLYVQLCQMLLPSCSFKCEAQQHSFGTQTIQY